MENLNNEFDTDYVNNLRKREPAKDVYRDDDEYMSPEEANFRYLQALASVQKEESQRRKIKLRKIAVGGAVVVPLTAAAIGTTILGVNIANKNTEKYLAEATSSVATYDNNHILDDPNSEISIRLANDVNKKDNLVKYINCSNELHKLHLSQFPDITIIDEEVEWKDPEVVEQLIEEYKEYYKKQSFKQHFNVGTRTVAFRARLFYHRSAATAIRADLAHAEKALLVCYLPRTPARAARFALAAGRSARAVTRRAIIATRIIYRNFLAAEGFF